MNDSDLDLEFKFEVARTKEGKTVLGCVQCGICSSSCPFSEELDTKPHEVIKMILLGMRKEALSCKKIWACATCYMCAERCPQGVETGNILMALANIAAKEKGIPKGLANIKQMIMEEGRVMKVTGMRIKERENLGLPPLSKPNIVQMKKILKETDVDKVKSTEE